jgi:tRNA U34 2-thiouridine synthase MnmA/TrmU
MKALLVFSGGLDSMLAAQVIRAQGIDVLGLFFETPFFSPEKAEQSAAGIHLPLKIIDLTEPHLRIVRKPKYGHGGNMNPCIDCHALMLRSAGDLLEKEGASFIVSGEVLGQRPMSQNFKALSIVAKESGFNGLILRPLCAKHLPVTVPEERGWVKREELLNLSGRSRKPQMELAGKHNIRRYPSPAGGCLLTDPAFSRRLKDLFSSGPECAVREIELLKVGRHFRLAPRTKLVVGRNKKENDIITSLSRESDLVLQVENIPGPTVLITGEVSPEQEALALSIIASYSDAKEDQVVEVTMVRRGMERLAQGRKCSKDRFCAMMI